MTATTDPATRPLHAMATIQLPSSINPASVFAEINGRHVEGNTFDAEQFELRGLREIDYHNEPAILVEIWEMPVARDCGPQPTDVRDPFAACVLTSAGRVRAFCYDATLLGEVV